MTNSATSKQEISRAALLIVQVILVAALLVTLTLSAISERGATEMAAGAQASPIDSQPASTAPPLPTPTLDAWTPTTETTTTRTATNAPPPTPTPPREPIVRTGSGDSVFYPQKWVGPAVVRISYDGSGPFVVWAQNAKGEREAMLANSAGPYHGDSLIDMLGIQRTLRLEVRTADAWQVDVLPLTYALHMTVPGAVSGSGDQVVVLDGPLPPDLLNVDASAATGSFSIWAYGESGSPVISGAAPYVGTVVLPQQTTALAVRAVGPWQLEVTTR